MSITQLSSLKKLNVSSLDISLLQYHLQFTIHVTSHPGTCLPLTQPCQGSWSEFIGKTDCHLLETRSSILQTSSNHLCHSVVPHRAGTSFYIFGYGLQRHCPSSLPNLGMNPLVACIAVLNANRYTTVQLQGHFTTICATIVQNILKLITKWLVN